MQQVSLVSEAHPFWIVVQVGLPDEVHAQVLGGSRPGRQQVQAHPDQDEGRHRQPHQPHQGGWAQRRGWAQRPTPTLSASKHAEGQ